MTRSRWSVFFGSLVAALVARPASATAQTAQDSAVVRALADSIEKLKPAAGTSQLERLIRDWILAASRAWKAVPAPARAETPSGCRNRPAAFTRTAASIDMSQEVPRVTGRERPVDSTGWTLIYDNNPRGGSNFSKITGAIAETEPLSPGSAWQLISHAGRFGGGVEGAGEGHGSGNIGRRIESGDVYLCYSIQWSSNFQWHEVSTKHLRLYPGVLIQALNNGRWMWSEDLNLGVGFGLQTNAPLRRGVWHVNEVLVIRGNPGTIKIWVDGRLVTSSTSQPITRSTHTEVSIDGHLGGGGMTVRQDMYYYIGHALVATP